MLTVTCEFYLTYSFFFIQSAQCFYVVGFAVFCD